MSRVVRYDRGTVTKIRRTPQGGVRVDAAVTRSGVFVYRRDGQEIREYRPPEEIFHADSLATLGSAPVTDRHPPEMVAAKNFRKYSAGHVVDGSARQDGELVAAELVIQDAALIDTVERRDRTQVSCGYTCTIDETPGTTPNGDRYDVVQRNVRYNHVAVVDSGRAGSGVAIRLDLAGDEIWEPDTESDKQEQRIMKSIRIDGVDYPLATDAEVQAAINAFARYDAATVSARSERDEVRGRMDAALEQVKSLEAKLAVANDPATISAAVARRSTVIESAAAILGTSEKFDALTEQQIMRDVIARSKPDIKLDDASDQYVSGLFAGLSVAAEKPRYESAHAKFRIATNRSDASLNDDDSPQAAKKRSDAASRNAWMAPLSASKIKTAE